MYAQAIVDSLNKRFHNLPIINASKKSSSKVLSKSNLYDYVKAMVGEIDHKSWIDNN